MTKFRTHYAGEISLKNVDQEVMISGWLQNKRILGELAFFVMRDTKGLVQVVVDDQHPELLSQLKDISNESTLKITGKVRVRKDKNPEMKTGDVEILATVIEVINKAVILPMLIEDQTDALEAKRMEYRYLDLRRNPVVQALKLRHKLVTGFREFLNSEDFLEIETPFLTKSTPEGARDFLVPSRVNPEEFYALPQSPQIYKNLLMNGGIEKYYQVVRCFRDEDLRADRQPEFTQLDIEMAFMSQEEIMKLNEKMMKSVIEKIKGYQLEEFPVIQYDDAMEKYGIDKPDIRFEMHLNDVKSIFEQSEFKVFKNAEYLKAIVVKNQASNYSRKDIEKLEEIAKTYQAKGLAWLKYPDLEFTGPIAKFINDQEKIELINKLKIEENDLLLFVADKFSVVSESLAQIRNHLGKELKLYDPNQLAFAWIINWPLFEYDEQQERFIAVHHPFTMPNDNKFNDDVGSTYAQAYDLVLNGYEIGGGSIRINNQQLQKQMFEYLGMSEQEYQSDFGFLLEAYSYGAPHHGGIAYGIDRIAMILSGSTSIRDVIAFSKNTSARDVMMKAPSKVSTEQLNDLSISTIGTKK